MTDRTQQVLLALATAAYVAAASMLAVADVPLSNRVALVQTFALFACGVLIVRRTDAPVIGWLLIVPGVTFNFIYDHLDTADVTESVPNAMAGTGVLDSLPLLGVLALGVLVLVFPSGRPVSPIARVALWLAVVIHATMLPLPFLADAGMVDVSAETGFNAMTVAFAGVVLVGLVEQVRRYRQRPRVEQLQLKWFIVAIVGQFLYPAMVVAGIESGTITFAVFDNIATTLWPVTILIAISRYRLYEIDRILSRTVGYGLVVATLAVIGIGGIAVVTSLLPTQDGLAVALSTLAVMALFDPLRRRVVGTVDRRFNRTRYVAQQVIEQFGRTVQDETDLKHVEERLDDVISRTMAPSTVAVWQPRGATPTPDAAPSR